MFYRKNTSGRLGRLEIRLNRAVHIFFFKVKMAYEVFVGAEFRRVIVLSDVLKSENVMWKIAK